MATMAEVKRKRVEYLKSLKPYYRSLDGSIEAAERELVRLVKRKRAFPEEADLLRVSKLTTDISTKLSSVVSALGKGYPQ